MRGRKLMVGLSMAAVVSASVWSAGRDGKAGAQTTYEAGVATTLRANRRVVPAGGEVILVAGLQNQGSAVAEFGFTCAPPVDFEVRNADGAIVWRAPSPCTGHERSLRLEAGDRGEWDTVWPGTNAAGQPVEPGGYQVWAIVHTAVRETVAGPLHLRVGEGGHEPGPEPSEPPHPEPTREPEPTHEPEPPVHETVPFLIGGGEGIQGRPDVAGHMELGDCQNLVVWFDDAKDEVWGRFVEREWRGDPFRISGDGGAAGPAAVAYNVGRHLWLVTWPVPSDAGDLDIVGRFVQCADLEGDVFAITDGELADDQVAVAAHGEGFAVAWRRSSDTNSMVMGAFVAGQQSRGETIIEDGQASEPAVACEAAEPCLIVWSQTVEGQRDVVGRWWWPREEVAGNDYLPVAAGEVDEHEAAVAWNGADGVEGYLVTWTAGPADASAIWARAYGATGVSGTQRDAYHPLTDAFGLGDLEPARQSDVTRLGHHFVVVWSEAARGEAEIRGQLVLVRREGEPATGAVVDVSRPVIDFPPTDSYPAVAWSGESLALVVWQSQTQAPDDPGEVYGRQRLFGSRIEIEGRVTGRRPASARARDPFANRVRLDVAVERVLKGRFSCTTARVYFDVDAASESFDVGDRVRVAGAPSASGDECGLDVGADGTSIAAAGVERRYAPSALTP